MNEWVGKIGDAVFLLFMMALLFKIGYDIGRRANK